MSEAEVREIVLVVVVGPSLPKVAGVNEAKTVELLTILRPGNYFVKIRLSWIIFDQIDLFDLILLNWTLFDPIGFYSIMCDQMLSNLTVLDQMGHIRLNWIIFYHIRSYSTMFHQILSNLTVLDQMGHIPSNGIIFDQIESLNQIESYLIKFYEIGSIIQKPIYIFQAMF